jgi:hypothetical protein
MAEQALRIEIENDQHHAFAPVPVGVRPVPVGFNRTVLIHSSQLEIMALLRKSEHNQAGLNACFTFRVKYSESR